MMRLALSSQQPLPWTVLLNYLQPRLIDDAERIDQQYYHRRVGAHWLRVGAADSGRKLHVEAPLAIGAPEADVRRRVARLFATEEDTAAAARHLRRCPLLAPRIERLPGLRPLGSWDAFELCLRTVLGQQVTVTAAGTLMRRLQSRSGTLTPGALLAADLSAMGMPGRRVDTLRALAQAVQARPMLLSEPWAQIDDVLRQLPGFGPWTRSYLAIRLGRQADAFPESDVGLMRAAGERSPRALLQRAESWRPYRALAATYLWVTS